MEKKDFSYLRERRRLPFYLSLLFSVLLMLWMFAPLMDTFTQEGKTFLAGFTVYRFSEAGGNLTIATDLLYTAFGLALLLLLFPLSFLFQRELKYEKRMAVILYIFYVAHLGCLVAFPIFLSQANTNIEASWGSYVYIVLSLLSLGLFTFSRIKTDGDTEKTLFRR